MSLNLSLDFYRSGWYIWVHLIHCEGAIGQEFASRGRTFDKGKSRVMFVYHRLVFHE